MISNGSLGSRSRKKKIQWAVLGFVCAVIVSAFVHPFGQVKATNSSTPLFSAMRVDAPVLDLVQKSCVSCHSEQTAWPWYSYLPVGSWLVEKDVAEGRQHFNMSRWDQYSSERRMEILAEVSAMVRNKQMPLQRYLWLHPGARLNDADVVLLDHWSHAERRRLKAQAISQGDN